MAEWKIIKQSDVSEADTTEALAPVTFAPGPNREWRIINVRVRVATGSTSPTTATPIIQVRDSAAAVRATYSGPTLLKFGASDTGKSVFFAPGLQPDTAFLAPDSLTWNVPIPEIVIPKDWDLNVQLEGGGTGDSLRIWMQAWQRSTM